MSKETKTISFQVKAEGVATNAKGQEVGVIDAYGAMFNNVDDGNDRILPGAFVRTLKNSKARAKAREKDYMLKMLWQHKAEDVIGGWMTVNEDMEGLRAKGHVLLATQRGREYYELAKAGMVDEFSIIYEVMADGAKYDKAGVRDLSDLRLYSIDPVTFAMNDATYTVGVKGHSVNTKQPPKDKKDFHDNYRSRQISDWCGELYSMTSAFRETCQDAFKSGDQPLEDILAALNGSNDSPGFIAAVQDWVQEGIELDYSNYLEELQENNPYASSYDYMARDEPLSRKAGRAISAANASTIQGHADDLHDLADDHLKAVKAHVKAIHAAADGLSSMTSAGGKEPDEGTQPDGKHKAASQPPARRSTARSSADTVTEEDVTSTLATLQSLFK